MTSLQLLQLNYYEAGLDLKLSEDPVENFHQFQTLVKAEYDALASEFNFNVGPSAMFHAIKFVMAPAASGYPRRERHC